MVPDKADVRIVPTPAELVAAVVMSSAAEPNRSRSIRGVSEDDKGLLKVRLVVIRSGERRAPVIHEVEVEVVQNDPATSSDDPAVVDVSRILSSSRFVLHGGRRGGSAGDSASE